jgi:hypothetical protein
MLIISGFIRHDPRASAPSVFYYLGHRFENRSGARAETLAK